jgi:hypothetical protein
VVAFHTAQSPFAIPPSVQSARFAVPKSEPPTLKPAALTLPVTATPLLPSDATPGSRFAIAPLALVAPVPPAVNGTTLSPPTVVPFAV